ncbi:MAG: type IV pilus twitching motility protein PilT [Dehalococcoidia bacterium]|nr:MAG: type IV pilus twitching motility protein PilT [Dehalococcoidia bacterium]
MKAEELLRAMVKAGASDLHLKVPNPPIFRIDGALKRQTNFAILNPSDMERMFREMTTPQQQETFLSTKELDFALSVPDVSRFRINIMYQRGTISIAVRQVPFHIMTIDMLNLPSLFKSLIMKPRGLILVTGPTGSGKSTTMAAMLQHLNENRSASVITIEDPIEYVFQDNKCIIAQRELGGDTTSYPIALRHALRHDPDVIVLGEIRDVETITTAIAAAETGHLVLGTLHTINAVQTVDRAIDMYPPSQQHQIRMQLSQVLEAVISQTLIPRSNGRGRVGCFEILLTTTAVRNLIREGKTFELHSIMQLNRQAGMQTLDQNLAELAANNGITKEEAMMKSDNPDRLERLIEDTKRNVKGPDPFKH